MKKKLYRSSTDKMICGVLAGFAEYIDVDPKPSDLPMSRLKVW